MHHSDIGSAVTQHHCKTATAAGILQLCGYRGRGVFGNTPVLGTGIAVRVRRFRP